MNTLGAPDAVVRLPLRGAREPPMDLYELGLQVLELSFDFGVEGERQHPERLRYSLILRSMGDCAILRNS